MFFSVALASTAVSNEPSTTVFNEPSASVSNEMGNEESVASFANVRFFHIFLKSGSGVNWISRHFLQMSEEQRIETLRDELLAMQVPFEQTHNCGT